MGLYILQDDANFRCFVGPSPRVLRMLPPAQAQHYASDFPLLQPSDLVESEAHRPSRVTQAAGRGIESDYQALLAACREVDFPLMVWERIGYFLLGGWMFRVGKKNVNLWDQFQEDFMATPPQPAQPMKLKELKRPSSTMKTGAAKRKKIATQSNPKLQPEPQLQSRSGRKIQKPLRFCD